VRDLITPDLRHKWWSDSEVVSESRARKSNLAARDRLLRDNTEVDGIDAMGLENWATSRDSTTAIIDHELSMGDCLATTDRPIASGRIKDKDTGNTS